MHLLFAIALAVPLLTLAVIDIRTQRLPDILTLPLALVGLVMAAMRGEPALTAHALAAALAWIVFSGLAALYRRVRGHEGLGRGDAKLLCAAGAWVGLDGLSRVVALAAMGALATIAVLALTTGWVRDRPLPFGPFLAAALWLVWV